MKTQNNNFEETKHNNNTYSFNNTYNNNQNLEGYQTNENLTTQNLEPLRASNVKGDYNIKKSLVESSC